MRPLRERLRGVLGGEKAASRPAAGTRRGPEAVREERLEPGFGHGADRLELARSAHFPSLAVLAGEEALGDYALPDALFLDTETTGLAGGAGTLVFLCGTVRWDGECFRLRQHFLRGPGEERRFLAGIAEDLERTRLLVTFCGKSFDRHRLADRFALQGMESEVRGGAHLDLLHLSRRVWGGLLPDTRLRTLEERVLELEREEDLPGAECPALYLDWLRGHAVDLEPAFAHNRLDILSLVTLMARLGRDPWAGPQPRPLLAAHGERLRKADPERAAVLFGRADRPLAQARCLERAGRYAEAVPLLEGLAAAEDRQALFELGRLYARRLGEPKRAIPYLCQALDRFSPGDRQHEQARRLLAAL